MGNTSTTKVLNTNEYKLEVNDAAEAAMGATLDTELSSRVEISVRGFHLKKKHKVNAQAVLYAKLMAENAGWKEIGRTEVVDDTHSPTFVKTAIVDYSFEKQKKLRVEMYAVKGPGDLTKQEFLGSMECYLAELVASTDVFERPLQHFGKRKSKEGKEGKVRLVAEEMGNLKYEVSFSMRGVKMKRMDFFSRSSDPFVVINRSAREKQESAAIYRSEVKKRNLAPVYDRCTMSVQALCRGDEDRPVVFDVFDWNLTQASQGMGSGSVTYQDIREAAATDEKKLEIPLTYTDSKGRKSPAGTLILEGITNIRKPSFLDYVHGGMEVALVVAVDFTLSNGDPSKRTSLHHQDHTKPNDYVMAIRAVGEILQFYDSDKRYPAYGFGAKVPPSLSHTSHCFSLKGNFFDPEVDGIEGIIEVYREALEDVTLHGPTQFNQVIKLAADFAEPCIDGAELKYFILLILTDGVINDMEKTINEIVRASRMPLSIIIVGVGDEDFSMMDKLDADVEPLYSTEEKCYMERDIVQFVQFNEFKDKSYLELALATLDEVPREVVNFFSSRGILPEARPRADSGEEKDGEVKDFEKEKDDDDDAFDLPPALVQARSRMIAHAMKKGYTQEECDEVLRIGLSSCDGEHLADAAEATRLGGGEMLKLQNKRAHSLTEHRSVSEGASGAWGDGSMLKKHHVSEGDTPHIPGIPESARTSERKDHRSATSPTSAKERAHAEKKRKKDLLDDDEGTCKICLDRPIDTVILECGHAVVCERCSVDLGPLCPLCRQPVLRIIRTYNT